MTNVPYHNVDVARAVRLFNLTQVPRWVTVRTIQRQSVAEHSFQVAWLAQWLAQWWVPARRGNYPPGLIVAAAMVHDEAEAITGDIVATCKHMMDELKNWEEGEGMGIHPEDRELRHLIKVADLMEAWLFLRTEEELGNSGILPYKWDIESNFTSAWDKFKYEDSHGTDIAKPPPLKMLAITWHMLNEKKPTIHYSPLRKPRP